MSKADERKPLIVIATTCTLGVAWDRCMVAMEGHCPEGHCKEMRKCPLRHMAMGGEGPDD